MDADPEVEPGAEGIGSNGVAYDSDDSDGSDKSDASVDSDDSGRTIHDGEDDDGKEQREREQAQHVNRVVIMRNCVIGKHWYADEEEAKENGDADKSLDAYGAFDADDEGAERMHILARAVQEELDKEVQC